MLGGNGEEGLSSMMMGKEEVVVTDAVEIVPSSELVRLNRSVRTQLCVPEQGQGYQGQYDQSKGLVEMGAWVHCFV